MMTRDASLLDVSDFQSHPVWEFINDDSVGERAVRPVHVVPTDSLAGKVVGIQVRLASGKRVWAAVANADSNDAQWNDHFLTLSLHRSRHWFGLARYHDFDYAERGPDALARFLEMDERDIFPIAYDLSPYAAGEREALVGLVLKEPSTRLTRGELVAMAVR